MRESCGGLKGELTLRPFAFWENRTRVGLLSATVSQNISFHTQIPYSKTFARTATFGTEIPRYDEDIIDN